METILQLRGASDTKKAVEDAKDALSALSDQHDDLEKRARATALLFETFSRHRDAGRLAYAVPYQAEIEKLARVVFG